MARPIANNGPLQLPGLGVRFRFYSSIPPSPPLYEERHPDRIKAFSHPALLKEFFSDLLVPEAVVTAFRHELDHDSESVFWVMAYWCMTAQPKDAELDPINIVAWLYLNGDVWDRQSLFRLLSNSIESRACHSKLGLLDKLLAKFACVFLTVDRHWIDTDDQRSSNEFFAEAFQRLILAFLLDPKNKEVMEMEIVPETRQPAKPRWGPWSDSESESSTESDSRKRPLSPFDRSDSKRRRIDSDDEVY